MIAVRRPTMVLVLTAVFVCAFALPGLAANRIHGVELVEQGGGTIIEIAGERAPNFTTFRQDSPRRVIVDVAECDLGAVPQRIVGDGRLVKGVLTAQYGQAPHGISRVVIALAREAEYRVTTRGGSLFVHITPGQGGLLVSAGVPVAPERRGEESSGLSVPMGVSPSAVADAEHTAPAEAPVLKNGPPDQEPGSVRVAMAKQAPDGLSGEPEPANVTGVNASNPDEVDMGMLPPPPLVIKSGPPDREPGQLALSAKPAPSGLSSDPEPSSASAPGDDDSPRAVRVAMLSAAPPAAPVRRVAQAEEEEAPPPPPPPAETEEEETPPPPPTPAEDSSAYSEVEEKVEIAGAVKDMTWVGFQQTMEASRVFVKTNEKVKYRVTEEGDNLVVLELENTQIPMSNNQRFLDTHFFQSAVTMITPQEIEGVSRNVRIEIQLRNRVPYSAGQEANMVFINFERPQQ